MGFFISVLASLLANLLWVAVLGIILTRGILRNDAWAAFRLGVLSRRSTVRFSASAVLRVDQGSEYLLALTPARGQSVAYWAPLGGVFKFRETGRGFLDQNGIQMHWLAGSDGDMRDDLRVKMTGRNFFRFIRWFQRGQDRETVTETLRREMGEELGELGLTLLAGQVGGLQFEVVRIARTGLYKTKTEAFYHYRIFYVCDLVGRTCADFTRELSRSTLPGKLEFIPQEEITHGAHNGIHVGSHAVFLFSDGPYRQGVPLYS
jgi:hypothetical protein